MENTSTMCFLEFACIRASVIASYRNLNFALCSIAFSSQLHSILLFPLPLSPVDFPSFSFVAFTGARRKMSPSFCYSAGNSVLSLWMQVGVCFHRSHLKNYREFIWLWIFLTNFWLEHEGIFQSAHSECFLRVWKVFLKCLWLSSLFQLLCILPQELPYLLLIASISAFLLLFARVF